MSKYQKWSEFLCDQLCNEMCEFEKQPNHETLKCIKDLVKTIAGMQEIETNGVMKKFIEQRYMRNGDEGKFENMDMWREDDDDIWDVYNATRRRRDSRGRFMPMNNMYDAAGGRGGSGRGGSSRGGSSRGGSSGGSYYGGTRGGSGYGQGGNYSNAYDAYNAGNISGVYPNMGGSYPQNHDRGKRRSDMEWDDENDFSDYDRYSDNLYMVRQENGIPMITPYNRHEKGMIPKKLTDEQYKEWVEGMTNADGTKGPHWTKEETKKLQEKKGMTEIDPCAFWAAANAAYSDMCKFFKKYGIDTADAYADYVKTFWFEDEDAVGGGKGNTEKLAAYYTAVVEH